jgi:hypothetical protein
MTPQEQQMIDDLVQRIRTTQVADKDVAAEHRLQQGLAGYPDAMYVLAQTVLVQQYGLEQAKAQIQQLQQQLDDMQQQLDQQQRPAPAQPAGGGSFLSHLFGTGTAQQAPPPQQPPYQPVNAGYAPYPPPPAYAQPAYPPPGYAAQPAGYGAGGGGFLRSALQTAAGVAAGEAAFAGMESLFHGFGGGGYSGGGFGGYEGGGRPEEIVNNYYEDNDRGRDQDRGRDDRADMYDSGRDDRMQDADYNSDNDISADYGPDDSSSTDDGSFSGDDGTNNF